MKHRLLSLLLRAGAAMLTRAGHAALAAQFFGAAGGAATYRHAQILWAAGRHEEALPVLEELLAGQPDHAQAHNLLAAIFLQAGDSEAAASHLERALDLQPEFPQAHNNLGNVWLARNDLEQACASYRSALAASPDYPDALTNLGSTLNMLGRQAEAEGYCRRAIELAPRFAGAYCNLGNVLLSQGSLGEAIAAYRTALELQPGLVEAQINLALATEDPAWLVGTIDYYEQLLQRHPDGYLPHLRIAQALQALNRWDEARERLRLALDINPEAADLMSLLGHNYVHAGEVDLAIACYRRALLQGYAAATQSSVLFNLLYLPGIAAESLCADFRRWASQLRGPQAAPVSAQVCPATGRRIKIGYVSRDLCRHSVSYFLKPILEQHDHAGFEVYCYSNLIRTDAVTERFRALADQWRDISTMSTTEVVMQIRADQIDILVDLSGHTAGNRLEVFAQKPAPLQLSYLGHPATTGLTAIDYRLGDAITDPPGASEAHYVETLWRLPGCFLTYQPAADAPSVAPLPGAISRRPTFASFNNVAKINDAVIAVWARILLALPEARLLLKSYAFATRSGRARIEQAFARQGVASERLDLVDWRPEMAHHLELYAEVDVGLDPFPYNGTTTTCEALWMGVPVVCLAGDRHSGRVGASLLGALGLEELLAANADDYVRIAVDLARDGGRLRALRESLRARMVASPLLDHGRFVRGLEQAYCEAWNRYQDSIVPAAAGQCEDGEPYRLHIGGQQARSGWKILNIVPGPQVDFVGDVKDLSAFRDNSVTHIYASHVLEHLDQSSLRPVLRDLRRIMRKPGGTLMISVPDMEVLCRLFLRRDLGDQERFHVMRMMFGGQTDSHDYHQIGLYFAYLSALLKEAGFHEIRRVESFGLFDDTSDYAPYGERISLNIVALS